MAHSINSGQASTEHPQPPKLSLVELCRKYSLELEPHGCAAMVCKCPFHSSESLSLVISEYLDTFLCLDCNATGNAEDLAERLANLKRKA